MSKNKLSGKMKAKVKKVLMALPLYTIQPGCLFYDVTDETPIGSKAIRAPDDGAVMTSNSILTPQWYGCNRIGYWHGRRYAFTTEYTKEGL